jgi:hypothetical protein
MRYRDYLPTHVHSVFNLRFAALLACFVWGSTFLTTSPLSAKTPVRIWSDPSGQYEVEAELVAADSSKAVLRNQQGELIVMQLDQLSKADRGFVDDFLSDQQTSNVGDDASGADSKWNLKDGQKVRGRLLGFGRETLILARRDGHVLVNGTRFDELSPAYQKIVPDVVSRIDEVDVDDLESLEDHLADGGAGPFRYVVAGIQVETRDGGVVTIPASLLRPADRDAVEPGLKRWLASQQEGVSEDERRETADTERLLLDSYRRLRDRSPAYPGSAAARPRVHPVQMMDLHLQAATAGVTDIWEVLLYPPTPYGYPRTVVVPAENSRGAMIAASRHYPGWRMGPARKLSF